jgi:hypothetical protein
MIRNTSECSFFAPNKDVSNKRYHGANTLTVQYFSSIKLLKIRTFNYFFILAAKVCIFSFVHTYLCISKYIGGSSNDRR